MKFLYLQLDKLKFKHLPFPRIQILHNYSLLFSDHQEVRGEAGWPGQRPLPGSPGWAHRPAPDPSSTGPLGWPDSGSPRPLEEEETSLCFVLYFLLI